MNKQTGRKVLKDLLLESRLVVCVGSGGVGKTTTAAALGIYAACQGRRVLVITIDPARRLANALGLESIGNRETEVAPQVFEEVGVECRGTLHAMMLDTRTTFDDLIARVSPDEHTRQRILQNNIYHQISSAISTSQDVMATEKLYDVYTGGRYDLIVLDTPPMKNALDFLEAPHRMTRFLDDKIIRWFVKPIEEGGGFSLGRRLIRSTGLVAYKLLGFIFGEEFLSDLNEFFLNFKDMTVGFRERSEKVRDILHSRNTSFLIICGPGRSSVEDARHFSEQLRERKLSEGGLIVNQVHTYTAPPAEPHQLLTESERAELVRLDAELERLLPRLNELYRSMHLRSLRDQQAVEVLRRLAGGSLIFRIVPRMVEEINDIPGLLRLNSHLFAPDP